MEHVANNPRTCLFCDNRGLTINDLADLYLEGRLDELEHREQCENGTDREKQLYEFMLAHHYDQVQRLRNSQWAPEIIRVLSEERNSTIVFAFGAGHFQGGHRVQKYLRDAGFEIDYIRADEPLL